jgi:hypothetical protein
MPVRYDFCEVWRIFFKGPEEVVSGEGEVFVMEWNKVNKYI